MTEYWIALNAIKGLGPVKIKQLLSHYRSPEMIFKEKPASLHRTGLLNDSTIEQIKNPLLLIEAERQVKKAKDLNIHILTLNDPSYPKLLYEIFAPPPVLYVKGSIPVFDHTSIAIVGTRKPSTYGKNAAAFITQELTEHAITIVSGLAIGVDSIAHATCLQNSGKTIAVLGSGLDTIYPASNRSLAEKIETSGAVITEFPLGTPPRPYHFPRRNRIISGLTLGTLVVEAGEKSGSLITAYYAIQQGRDVFAIPGSIFSEKSNGTLKIIKNGAIPIQSAKDVLENIDRIRFPFSQPEVFEKPFSISYDNLNHDETNIVKSLSMEPQRLDQIAIKTNKDLGDLFALLLNLELKGIVKQVAGQQYVRI